MRFIYSKNFIRAFAVFVLIALVIIFDRIGWLNSIKGSVLSIGGSINRRFSNFALGSRDFLKTFVLIKNLTKDNAKLSQQVDELSFENARLNSSKTENVSLRKALGLKETSKLNLIASEVLVLDPTGFSQTVVIDKGSSDGGYTNAPVVVAPGLLVGKVVRTYLSTSEVKLITDPSFTVNAEVADSGSLGLIRGEHGLSLVLELVTQKEVIKTGDLVSTSGLGGEMPKGLLIGEISAITSNSSDLFQKAYITPAADLKNLRFIFVVIGVGVK